MSKDISSEDLEIIKKSIEAIPDAYEQKDMMTNMFIDACRSYWIKGYKQAKEDILKQSKIK